MVVKLNDDIIKYIAAGEVIESPYSVVKELIENSIDANADTISIYLKNGGIDEIKVYDNGDGIDYSSLKIVAERYTTSKIATIEDVNAVSTLGFRGEALASISIVSKLEIISCHKNSIDRTAYKAIYSKNKIIDILEYPHPQGTTVTVKDLFFETPARKKFLKTKNSENRDILDLVTKFSIIYSNIRFSLHIDEKCVYSTYGGNNKQMTFLSAMKKLNKSSQLMEIDYQQNNIRVTGFISNSSFVVKRKKFQILSFNKRLVENTETRQIIEQGYRKFIPKNLYPIYYINIEVDSNSLDVNCHPRKTDVRYSEQETLNAILVNIISSLFFHASTEKENDEDNIFDETEEKSYNIIGQLKNSYIVIEYNETVYFIDQHALHERILYENFKKALKDKTIQHLPLNETVVLHLNEQTMELFYQKQEILEQYGFDICLFGNSDLLIREVPYLIADNNGEEIIDIVETIIENNKSDWLDLLSIELSCKSAIKANTNMTIEIIKEFINYMIDNKLTNCPHGRPIFFTMSFNEMNRKLRRTI